MSIFTRRIRAFFLNPVTLSLVLIALFASLVLSPQKAFAAPTAQQSTTSPGCIHVTYTVTNQWSSGAVIVVTITNDCTTPIIGCWNLQFDFTAGQQITQMWNASFTQSGSAVTVTSCVTIPPGGSFTIGFVILCEGSNPPPINLTFNGEPV